MLPIARGPAPPLPAGMNSAFKAALEPVSAPEPRARALPPHRRGRKPPPPKPAAPAAPEVADLPASKNATTAPATGNHCLNVCQAADPPLYPPTRTGGRRTPLRGAGRDPVPRTPAPGTPATLQQAETRSPPRAGSEGRHRAGTPWCRDALLREPRHRTARNPPVAASPQAPPRAPGREEARQECRRARDSPRENGLTSSLDALPSSRQSYGGDGVDGERGRLSSALRSRAPRSSCRRGPPRSPVPIPTRPTAPRTAPSSIAPRPEVARSPPRAG